MNALLSQLDLLLKFISVILLVSYVSVEAGGGRRRGPGQRFNHNNNNNRYFGNNNNRRGPFYNRFGNNHYNHNNNNNNNNGRFSPHYNSHPTTCPRPVFEDAELEIENCLDNSNNNNYNPACYDTSHGIPVNWKGKMVCQRGNHILKYTSFCLHDGTWTPAFVDNCDQVFEIQNSNSYSNHEQPDTPTSDVEPSLNYPHGQSLPCKMLQIRLSQNFVLTCLTPPHTKESHEQCVGSNENVASGTKVFLRCKPPFSSPTNENSEWTCRNGDWDGVTKNMVCIFEQTGNKETTTTSTTRRPTLKTTKAPTTTTTLAPVIIMPSVPKVVDPNPGTRTLCPPLTQRTAGVEIACIIGGSRVYGTSCNKWNVVGTEASYTCKKYYESTYSLNTLYRTCKNDGTWTGSSDVFACVAKCGISNALLSPRITFGVTTYGSQWPWHAAIYLQNKPGNWTFICGGTILTSLSIVTAAHCVTLIQSTQIRDSYNIRVEIGKSKREQRDEFVQVKDVKTIDIHDSYDPFSFDSDIAIIILKEEISFGYHVRPVCFPQVSDSALEEQQIVPGSIGIVVGFGTDENGNLSDDLKMTNLPVVSQGECSDVNGGGSLSSINSRSTTYCAGFRNATNVCNGDSGGGMVFPLNSEDTTRWYLQGIVSAGISNDGKCDSSKYAVFTRVGRYATWITRTLSLHDVF